jgi:arylsulfatase A-like enzyme
VGLAGLERPATFEGKDFAPLLRGEPFEGPKSQLIMHIAKDNASGGEDHPAPLFRGLRTDHYTYAEIVKGDGLLFDNRSDPYQQKNLYTDPKLNDLRTKLHAELLDSLRRAHDPLGAATPS